ncbi:hypothetical protein DH2020_047362 [Rehmannia glutinosa]|uniref:Uncharacterized protein n=1 Tax=Rehmannia glutinosa TaxID=99300 RepID=A0ABR0U8U5_REHGL
MVGAQLLNLLPIRLLLLLLATLKTSIDHVEIVAQDGEEVNNPRDSTGIDKQSEKAKIEVKPISNSDNARSDWIPDSEMPVTEADSGFSQGGKISSKDLAPQPCLKPQPPGAVRDLTPRFTAMRIPLLRRLVLTSLLEAPNPNHRYLRSSPFGLVSTMPAPNPVAEKVPSTCRSHAPSSASGCIISCKKSASACAFTAVQGRYSISNSPISIAHLIILPNISGLSIIRPICRFVRTTTLCERKYYLSFLADYYQCHPPFSTSKYLNSTPVVAGDIINGHPLPRSFLNNAELTALSLTERYI